MPDFPGLGFGGNSRRTSFVIEVPGLTSLLAVSKEHIENRLADTTRRSAFDTTGSVQDWKGSFDLILSTYYNGPGRYREIRTTCLPGTGEAQVIPFLVRSTSR